MDFSQVTSEFRRLKTQYDTGSLSEADFKARLQDLMLQDEQGRWWMIGTETGQWYVHDGEKWVQSEPPPVAEPTVRATETSQPEAPARAVTPPAAPARRRWVWVVAGIIGIIGLILAIVLLRSGTTPGPVPAPGPEVRLWADRDTIRPEACTWLHWNVPGAEHVRIAGPGFDPDSLLPGSGEREVCLRETTAFRLLSPDGQGIETMVIYVR